VKVGDLVTVAPAESGLYLVVQEDLVTQNKAKQKMWILYNYPDVIGVTMAERWIKVVVPSSVTCNSG